MNQNYFCPSIHRFSLCAFDYKNRLGLGFSIFVLCCSLPSHARPVNSPQDQKSVLPGGSSDSGRVVPRQNRSTDLDFSQISKIKPTRTLVSASEVLRLTNRTRVSTPSPISIEFFPIEKPLLGPDGISSPIGFKAAVGERVVLSPDSKGTLVRENAWTYQPSATLQQGYMLYPIIVDPKDNNWAFRPLVVSGMDVNKKSYVRLFVFNSERGLVWERDITAQLSLDQPIGSPDGLEITDVSITGDGSSTLLALRPFNINNTNSSRILVFDKSGELLSTTNLKGMTVSGFRRCPSEQRFLLTISLKYINGKLYNSDRTTGYLLLDKQGSVNGVFTGEDGNLRYDWMSLNNDDSIGGFSKWGLIYQMPQDKQVILNSLHAIPE